MFLSKYVHYIVEKVGISTVDFIADLIRAIIALFIIVDPLGNIPVFMGLTEKINPTQRRKVYNIAILVSFILLLIFAFLGQEILVLFGLSIYSFQVAGGILLLIIAIRILVSGNIHENVESTESLGAVPIAMPLLVGPGAITATMFNLQTYGIVSAILAVIIVLSITWIILRSINIIYKILGKTGALVIARVMALLIAAIAIQYILTGINHFIT
ncbi:MAG: MarC family protein [Candidatus Bathyarchaeota archaeon]|nr:MarC family protein [Candidatus Bathyarchaeota archaeon]MDD4326440.1 MarC family protein [Candidatus Bathyarchaeota archaeon]NLD65453.1 MarC family protein [Thermoproteota archaeon]